MGPMTFPMGRGAVPADAAAVGGVIERQVDLRPITERRFVCRESRRGDVGQGVAVLSRVDRVAAMVEKVFHVLADPGGFEPVL